MGKGNFYTDLPPWAKAVVIIGGAAVTIYSVHFIYQKFSKAKDLKDMNKAADLAENELKELAKGGVVPTISDTTLEGYAQKIKISLEGCTEWEQPVIDIMAKMQNEADILRLVKIFGLRYVTPCAVTSPISYVVSWFDGKNTRFAASINEIITWGLTQGQIKTINDNFAKKNIKYRF